MPLNNTLFKNNKRFQFVHEYFEHNRAVHPSVSGYMLFDSGFVTITDPCYPADSHSWITLKNIPLMKGIYKIVTKRIYQSKLGNRVVSLSLELNTCRDNQYINIYHLPVKQKELGYIGVDSGLAGFFVNKPDYNDQEWLGFADQTINTDNAIKKAISKLEHQYENLSQRVDFDAYRLNQIYKIDNDDSYGVFSQSGLGDGNYKVTAEYPSVNENIPYTSIKIEFINESDFEDIGGILI